MSHRPLTTAATALLVLGAMTLGGCGRQGVLQQPAPLFGDQARADYAARQAAKAAQNPAQAGAKAKPAADEPDPDADNAPLTRRDLQAPSQRNVPISKEPILGVPDLSGPTPSMSPPGAR